MGYTSLKSLFKGITDSLRNKLGITDIINHQDIPKKIDSIPQGGISYPIWIDDGGWRVKIEFRDNDSLVDKPEMHYKIGHLGNYVYVYGVCDLINNGIDVLVYCAKGYTSSDFFSYSNEFSAFLDYTGEYPILYLDVDDIDLSINFRGFFMSSDEDLTKIDSCTYYTQSTF